MPSVAIVVTERCQASSVFTIVDMLLAANYAARRFVGEAGDPFQVRLVGLHTRETAYNGYALAPLERLTHDPIPQIVLLPGAFESVLSTSQAGEAMCRLDSLYPQLRRWHAAGAVIGSVCTGNFLVAQAGLAKERTLSCHWASLPVARELFPTTSFVTEKLLIDHGDLISAGGALSVAQLVLYLIQRWHSRELALATAKLMLVEPNYESQSRFAIFSPSRSHGDAVVTALQAQIDEHPEQSIDFRGYAESKGLTERHLSRRFKKATGVTPLGYQQRMRIERVKSGLETTRKQMNSLVWEVGYEDLASFRRLFKRQTGMTMQDYRRRFAL